MRREPPPWVHATGASSAVWSMRREPPPEPGTGVAMRREPPPEPGTGERLRREPPPEPGTGGTIATGASSCGPCDGSLRPDIMFVPQRFGHGTINVQESIGIAVEMESGCQDAFHAYGTQRIEDGDQLRGNAGE